MNQKAAMSVDVNSRHIYSKNLTFQSFSRFWNSEFLRYFFVSLVAFMLDLSIFSACIRNFGLPWVAAATLGFVVGLLVAYVLSVRFVFTSRKFFQTPIVELLTFSTVGVGGLGVTQLVLWVGIEKFKMNPEVCKFCAAGFTFIFNFGVRKLLLFNTPSVSSFQRRS